MKVIDSHQHFWDLDRFPYTWCRSYPTLDRTFSLGQYGKASESLGVEATVWIESNVDEPHQLEEARYVQCLSERNPIISGIVAGCRPEHPGFEAHLDELEELPSVKGVRRVLHVVPDEVSQAPLFTDNVKRLAEYSFSFDLCVLARQLPLALALVEKCPQVSFILDHCGIPDVKGRTFDLWAACIAEIARHPNVACKVSGLVAYADPEAWKQEDLEPWVAHVIDTFGWNRVLWGSDWPVCTLASSFATWLKVAQALVRHATEEQQERFFWRNAERIYRLNSQSD